jgi:hypothetical protein
MCYSISIFWNIQSLSISTSLLGDFNSPRSLATLLRRSGIIQVINNVPISYQLNPPTALVSFSLRLIAHTRGRVSVSSIQCNLTI